MKLSRRLSDKTFSQRLAHVAIWWGIPMVCVELIGMPLSGWPFGLALTLPATALGVFVGAAIEHWFFKK